MKRLLLLLTLAASAAAQMEVGPELPATEPRFVPASGRAVGMGDGRAGMVAVQLAGSPSSVMVQPLDADGRPATEHGITLSGSGSAILVDLLRLGDGWLVAWMPEEGGALRFTRVAADGSPGATLETLTFPPNAQLRLASNGSEVLAVWIERKVARAARLMSDGSPIGEPFALDSRYEALEVAVASNGDGWLAAINVNECILGVCAGATSFVPVARGGGPGAPRTYARPSRPIRLVFDGATYLAAWSEPPGIAFAATVDPAGGLGPVRDLSRNAPEVTAATGGNGSLLLFGPASAPSAMRLAPGGTPLDASPTFLPPSFAGQKLTAVALASDWMVIGGASYIVRLSAPAEQASLLLTTAVAQQRPRAIRLGDTTLIAWLEPDNAIVAGRVRDGRPLDGGGIPIGQGVVSTFFLAGNGQRALITWQDRDGNIVGRLFAADGTVSPLQILGPVIFTPLTGWPIAAVPVDDGFLVLLTGTQSSLFAVQVRSDGLGAFAPWLLKPFVSPENAAPRNGGFLLLSNTSSPLLTPFTSDGIPSAGHQASNRSAGMARLAADGNGHFLLASANGGIWARLADDSGRPIAPEQNLGPPEISLEAVVWSGASFWLFSRNQAARVGRNGIALDPFTPLFTDDGAPIHTTAAPGLMVYEITRPAPGLGNAPRLVMRTFRDREAVRRRAR